MNTLDFDDPININENKKPDLTTAAMLEIGLILALFKLCILTNRSRRFQLNVCTTSVTEGEVFAVKHV